MWQAKKGETKYKCDEHSFNKKMGTSFTCKGTDGVYVGHGLIYENGGPFCTSCMKPVLFKDMAQHICTAIHQQNEALAKATKVRQQTMMQVPRGLLEGERA